MLRALRLSSLLVAGTLVTVDADAVAVLALVVTVVLLACIGFADRRARAMLWAAPLVVSAVIGDALWQLEWEPFDRSDEYEATPFTPVVLIGLPLPMAVIGAGAGFGALWQRSHPTGATREEWTDLALAAVGSIAALVLLIVAPAVLSATGVVCAATLLGVAAAWVVRARRRR